LYKEDFIFTRNNPKMFEEFMQAMTKEFEMIDIGFISYYLGIEIVQGEDGIFMNQEKFAKGFLRSSR